MLRLKQELDNIVSKNIASFKLHYVKIKTNSCESNFMYSLIFKLHYVKIKT